MNEHPILFSGEMVKAILTGRKTQTRRIVKPQPPAHWLSGDITGATRGRWLARGRDIHFCATCPYGERTDTLWVRERIYEGARRQAYYFADQHAVKKDGDWYPFTQQSENGWASIHMPRWASRITLEIVSVRVERLQDISEDDARAEGIDTAQSDVYLEGEWRGARINFRELWDSINGKKEGANWEANPWVWVIEFKRIDSLLPTCRTEEELMP